MRTQAARSQSLGLPWEVLFLLESPLCCLCELQPGLSPPRGPRPGEGLVPRYLPPGHTYRGPADL